MHDTCKMKKHMVEPKASKAYSGIAMERGAPSRVRACEAQSMLAETSLEHFFLSLERLRRHSAGSVRRAFDGPRILVRKAPAASVADFMGLRVYPEGTLKRLNHALQEILA